VPDQSAEPIIDPTGSSAQTPGTFSPSDSSDRTDGAPVGQITSAIGRDAGIGSEDFEVAAVSDHRSAFHGQRMPFAQPGTVNAAIKQTLAGLAETAGVAYISEVTQNADGTYQVEIRTRGKAGQANGPTLTLRAKACSLTGSDVGRGAVNRDTGEATVEISDRAVSRAVPRALAHAIAVAAAIIDGSAARATILADQVLSAENLADLSAVSPDLSAVSPEDRARLAELRYEAGQLGSLNPVRSWRAAREVAALMRLLGLVAGTPSLEGPESSRISQPTTEHACELCPWRTSRSSAI